MSSTARSSSCGGSSRAKRSRRRCAQPRSSTRTIRAAREEAARRLARQLDIAVERFSREAESVLAERVDTELRAVEARLKDLSKRLDTLTARA